MYHGNERMMDTIKDIKPKSIRICVELCIMRCYIQYQAGRKCWVFYNYLYTVTLAHMWLLNNLSIFVKNVIIVKHNTSAIGKTCPSVVLYCFLKSLRECQFFKEIVNFQKSDPFIVLFQTAITLLILTLHWKAMLFWKCLYTYFNFKWLFDVAPEVKILLLHTYHRHGVWCVTPDRLVPDPLARLGTIVYSTV